VYSLRFSVRTTRTIARLTTDDKRSSVGSCQSGHASRPHRRSGASPPVQRVRSGMKVRASNFRDGGREHSQCDWQAPPWSTPNLRELLTGGGAAPKARGGCCDFWAPSKHGPSWNSLRSIFLTTQSVSWCRQIPGDDRMPHRVIEGSFDFRFTMTAIHPTGASCRTTFSLHLEVKDRIGKWL
jgi:hypothetical protein